MSVLVSQVFHHYIWEVRSMLARCGLPTHRAVVGERGYLAQQIAYNRAKDMPKMAAFDEKIKEIIR